MWRVQPEEVSGRALGTILLCAETEAGPSPPSSVHLAGPVTRSLPLSIICGSPQGGTLYLKGA